MKRSSHRTRADVFSCSRLKSRSRSSATLTRDSSSSWLSCNLCKWLERASQVSTELGCDESEELAGSICQPTQGLACTGSKSSTGIQGPANLLESDKGL